MGSCCCRGSDGDEAIGRTSGSEMQSMKNSAFEDEVEEECDEDDDEEDGDNIREGCGLLLL